MVSPEMGSHTRHARRARNTTLGVSTPICFPAELTASQVLSSISHGEKGRSTRQQAISISLIYT